MTKSISSISHPTRMPRSRSFGIAAACAFAVVPALAMVISTTVDGRASLADADFVDVLSVVGALCAAVSAFSFLMIRGYPRFEKFLLAALVGAIGYAAVGFVIQTASADPIAKRNPPKTIERKASQQ